MFSFPRGKDTLDKKYINSSILRQSTSLACFGVISRSRNSHLLCPPAEKTRLQVNKEKLYVPHAFKNFSIAL